MDGGVFVFEDDNEAWSRDLLENHLEAAQSLCRTLLEDTTTDANGCKVTSTRYYRKVQFRGRQLPVYRFIALVRDQVVVSKRIVVRHRCHNRLCINPDHLQLGSYADNKRDDKANWANGVDFDYL